MRPPWLSTASFATGQAPERTPELCWGHGSPIEVSPESRQYPLVISGRTAPLLEREEQLALIERLLVETREGHGAFVLLEGPAGIGKSRLLDAACEAAETHGVQVLRARGGELEVDFSYGVVRQLFEARGGRSLTCRSEIEASAAHRCADSA
jgi:hypothetical protein